MRRRRDDADRRRVLVEMVTGTALPVIEPLLETFLTAWAAHLDRYEEEQLRLMLDFTARSNEIVQHAIRHLQAGTTEGKPATI